MMTRSGIYCIEDLEGRKYIGSSQDINLRWNNHKRQLRSGKHCNFKLQVSWSTYGNSYFTFSILELCKIEELFNREQYYLDTYSPYYNILALAGSVRGFKHTEDFKIARRAFRHTEAAKLKISEAKRGIKFSEEHKANLSKSMLGKSHTEETKEKLREVGKARGISSEMQEAANLANRTRQRTPQELDALKRANAARKGKPMKEAHRQALVEAWKRRKAKSGN